MIDIFISYASADRDRARAIADALEQRGLTVWWDRVIPPGRQYDEVIEENLAAAKCVVVLWSASSAASKWVKIEAGEALRKDRLVPALIETDVRIPLEFSRVQAADLSTWRAGQTSEAFEQFFAALSNRPAPGPAPKPPSPPPAPGPQGWGRKQWGWVGAAVLVAGGLSQVPSPAPAPTPSPSPAPSPSPSPAPSPSPSPGPVKLTPPVELFDGGIDSAVQWRDHILNYSGKLFWDGRSTLGRLGFTAVDQGNGRQVAGGDYQVLLLQVNPQRIRFNLRLDLAGDSHTPQPHSHDINLIYDRQPNGRWRFVQNCPAPNTCY
jgi:hypothetical protein